MSPALTARRRLLRELDDAEELANALRYALRMLETEAPPEPTEADMAHARKVLARHGLARVAQ